MNSKIKIGMIALDLDRTGISTVIMNCCRNIDRAKFDIDLLVGDRVVSEYIEECKELGVEVIEFPLKHRDSKGYYMGLLKVLKAKKYDIVHVHGNSAMVTPDLFLAFLAGTKARVVHSHNTTCDHITMHKMLSPIFHRLYKKGIACSTPAGEWMFGNRPFEVLPNGIQTEHYRYDEKKRQEFRKRLGVTDEFLLGHIAQYTVQKNHPFLLKAFEEIAKEHENVKLLLVGSGPNFDEIMQKIEQHPYKERIIVLGDSSEIDFVYNAIDAFVLPSLFEGLPLVLVEAQAAGLTCLVSDKVARESDMSGNIEFVTIDSAKAWEQAVAKEMSKKKENREKKSQKARECIIKNKYDVQSSVLRLQEIYKDLLS